MKNKHWSYEHLMYETYFALKWENCDNYPDGYSKGYQSTYFSRDLKNCKKWNGIGPVKAELTRIKNYYLTFKKGKNPFENCDLFIEERNTKTDVLIKRTQIIFE